MPKKKKSSSKKRKDPVHHEESIIDLTDECETSTQPKTKKRRENVHSTKTGGNPGEKKNNGSAAETVAPSSESEVCAICLESPIVDPCQLSDCVHLFCKICIERWSEIETSCPLCKKRYDQFTETQDGRRAHRVESRTQRPESILDWSTMLDAQFGSEFASLFNQIFGGLPGGPPAMSTAPRQHPRSRRSNDVRRRDQARSRASTIHVSSRGIPSNTTGMSHSSSLPPTSRSLPPGLTDEPDEQSGLNVLFGRLPSLLSSSARGSLLSVSGRDTRRRVTHSHRPPRSNRPVQSGPSRTRPVAPVSSGSRAGSVGPAQVVDLTIPSGDAIGQDSTGSSRTAQSAPQRPSIGFGLVFSGSNASNQFRLLMRHGSGLSFLSPQPSTPNRIPSGTFIDLT